MPSGLKNNRLKLRKQKEISGNMHSIIGDFYAGAKDERERIDNAYEKVNWNIYHIHKVIMAGNNICCKLLRDSRFQPSSNTSESAVQLKDLCL